jgi:hypothetical protein
LLVATKLAHDELGEKVALFVGCATASVLHGRESTYGVLGGNFCALVLIECVSDMVKDAIYLFNAIDTGVVTYVPGPTLLTAMIAGASSCAALLGGVRINCLVQAQGL